MKKQSIVLLLTLWSLNSQAQTFVSDSLMSIYVESGIADQNFIPKGKSKKDVRIGKWIDYTFEFIHTYQQNADIVDESFEHLLIQSIGEYSMGQKNGLWQFYALEEATFEKFHMADVTFKNGKIEGPITLYYSSGEKAAEGNNKDELLHGTFTVFYKTGEVARKSQIKEDKIQGILTYFYRTGEKRHTVNFVDGSRNGEFKSYYKNGAIKGEKTYVNDTLQGLGVHYYPSGKTQEEGIYEDDKLVSVKYYYESGQLWVNKEYKDGKYFNVLELYDSLGSPLDSGTLKDGTGTVKYYTEDARVYLIRTFQDGKVLNEEHFD